MKISQQLGILAALALVGCGHGSQEFQSIVVDKKVLAVTTAGETAGASTGSQNVDLGETVHRVIHGKAGEILFAYDLSVKRGNPGAYVLHLKPAAQAPTFARERSVSIQEVGQSVRVELMENPQTGKTLADAYRFFQPVTLGSLHRDLVRALHLEMHGGVSR